MHEFAIIRLFQKNKKSKHMINPDSLTANSTALCQPVTETFGDKELASELMTVPGAVKYAQEIAPTESYG